MGGDPLKMQLHGLRLAGVYGPQIVVRDNLFEDTFKGVVLQTTTRPRSCVWAFQCNVGWRVLSDVLDVPDALRQTVIDEHNRKAD